jgi:hypothetical protein
LADLLDEIVIDVGRNFQVRADHRCLPKARRYLLSWARSNRCRPTEHSQPGGRVPFSVVV